MSETPWPAGVVHAYLHWPVERAPLGELWFIDPNGERAVIHVDTKATDEGYQDSRIKQNVWRITELDDGTVRVSPSIHYIGRFHSPRPVRFRLVASKDDLPGWAALSSPDSGVEQPGSS